MPDTQVSEAAIRAPNMTIFDEVENFLETCAAATVGDVDAAQAANLRKLQREELALRKKIEAAHKVEKEPFLEGGRLVDAKYKPLLTKAADAIKAVTRKLTAFMEAEEAKARAAAEAARRQAEEEAARAAALAAQAEAVEEDDPFAAFDTNEEARKAEAEAAALARQAAAPVKVNVASADGGKAAGLRTVGWNVTVTDPSEFVAHFAERMEILDLAVKLAEREAKATNGQAKIPGCTLSPIRKAV